MMAREYRVEVFCTTTLDGEEIWIPVGYEMVFDNPRSAEGYRDERQREYPKDRYRIVFRKVGEWQEMMKNENENEKEMKEKGYEKRKLYK